MMKKAPFVAQAKDDKERYDQEVKDYEDRRRKNITTRTPAYTYKYIDAGIGDL